MRRTLWIALVLAALGGCLPVLVGGLIIKSSKTRGQKQEFMNQLQRTNADRETHGLQPLDWCSEAYHFDKGWAMQDVGCSTRIKAYEAGDVHALDAPVIAAPAADTASHTTMP